MCKIGMDFDGTIFNVETEELLMRPPQDETILITGRSDKYAQETVEWLHSYNIYNPISFNPGLTSGTDKEGAHEQARQIDSATHKARIIRMHDVKIFYEDDLYQANIIKQLVPNVLIRLVKKGRVIREF